MMAILPALMITVFCEVTIKKVNLESFLETKSEERIGLKVINPCHRSSVKKIIQSHTGAKFR